jgi:hypothetical protein
MPRTVNLGRLLDVVYTRDVWMHTIDIAEAIGRELPMTHTVNRRIVQDVVVDWVRRHRQPVELVLTGPSGGRYRSGASGAGLELDAIDFCRILSGRVPGEGLLKTKNSRLKAAEASDRRPEHRPVVRAAAGAPARGAVQLTQSGLAAGLERSRRSQLVGVILMR